MMSEIDVFVPWRARVAQAVDASREIRPNIKRERIFVMPSSLKIDDLSGEQQRNTLPRARQERAQRAGEICCRAVPPNRNDPRSADRW
jgi:hypothetical protein